MAKAIFEAIPGSKTLSKSKNARIKLAGLRRDDA